MSATSVADAIRLEELSGPTDETKSIRVRRGVYSLRGRPGYYMVRLRIPGGIVSAVQLAAIAELLEKAGWATGVHLTTRQSIEIPGVSGKDVPAFIQHIETAGLSTLLTGGNAVRGVVCCPLAGATENQPFDVTPYALAIDKYFSEHPSLTRMPRKIKIAVESCDQDHVHTLVTDIGLRARNLDGRPGFRIFVAGGLGASPRLGQLLEDFVPVEHLLSTLEAILHVFDRNGDRTNRARSRLKWLVADWGIEKFRAEVHAELAQAPASPEITSLLEPRPEFPAPAPRGSVSAVSSDHAESYIHWLIGNTILSGDPDYSTVILRCPLGDADPAQLRAVAEAAMRFAGGIRISMEQNFVLRGVHRKSLPALYEFLFPTGLATCCADQLLDITRCAGSGVCLSAITSSRSAAMEISEALAGELATDPVLRHLRVRVSGCPNSCSHHHASDIGLFGVSKKINGRSVPHYALLVGGSSRGDATGQRLIDIPASRVGEAVSRTLRVFRDERLPEESFATFVERAATSRIRAELEPLTVAPSPEEDPSFYRDIAADKDFKVESKRGECAY